MDCVKVVHVGGPRSEWRRSVLLGLFRLISGKLAVVRHVRGPLHQLNVLKKSADRLSKPVSTSDTLAVREDRFGSVPVRVYEPARRVRGGPGVIFFHGGGWTFGSVGTYDELSRHLAEGLDMTVVSVDYRLAPQHVYPAALEDCLEATQYFLQHAESLEVDPRRIAVVGDSAGGNLAAAVILAIRKSGAPIRPKLQVLNYPALQTIDLNTPSYQQNARDAVLTRKTMIMFYLNYAQGHMRNLDAVLANRHIPADERERITRGKLNHDMIPKELTKTGYHKPACADGIASVWDDLRHVFTDPSFAPLLEDDLSDLPDTVIVTMEKDVLRDDGFMYAARLRDAGVSVTHIHVMGGFHGLPSFLWLNDGRAAAAHIETAIKDRL